MNQLREVQIHLVIHLPTEDLKVDFPFDLDNDTIDAVVEDLLKIQNLQLTEEEKANTKAIIANQIAKTQQTQQQLIEPIEQERSNSPTAFNPGQEEPSSDEDMTEPEYQELIKIQDKEMKDLLAKHMKERIQFANQIEKLQIQPAANQETSTGDDLIVF